MATGGTSYDINQWYSPSTWDVPNRVSLGWSYDIPGVSKDGGFVRRLTTGFNLGSTTVSAVGQSVLRIELEPAGLDRHDRSDGHGGQLQQ